MSDPHKTTEIIERAVAAAGNAKEHDCTQGAILSEIRQDVKSILDRLAKGDTKLELFEHRIASLEKIVYGMVAVILLAVVGALVALVVKGGHA